MITGVKIKKLKVIPDKRGLLIEMMRVDDEFFQKFGQVYLSVCKPGYAKAWHYHKIQTDHFVVVKGNAKVALYDGRKDSKTYKEINDFAIGEKKPILIVIPNGVYHGYTPIGDEPAYLINIPSESYNYKTPDEHRASFDDPKIGYDWGVEEGDSV
jgi:dTDP-4-dehydrorhamnose 3,5-epimerase